MRKRMHTIGEHPLCCFIRSLDARVREHDLFPAISHW
jgi:hypothetical protein